MCHVVLGLLLSTVMEPPEDQSIFEKIVANVTQEEIDFMKIFGIDDGDGTIDNKEFIILTVVRIGAAPPHLINQINERFRMLDRKREGRISYDDLVYGRKKKITRQQSIRMTLARTMSSSNIVRQLSGTSGKLVRQVSGTLGKLVRHSSGGGSGTLDVETPERPAPPLGGGSHSRPRQLSTGLSRGTSAITLHSMSSFDPSSASPSPGRGIRGTSPKSPRGHKSGKVLPVDGEINAGRMVERATSNVETFVRPVDSDSDASICSETFANEESAVGGGGSILKKKPVGSVYASPSETGLLKAEEESKETFVASASFSSTTQKVPDGNNADWQRLSGIGGAVERDLKIRDAVSSSSEDNDSDYFDEEAQAIYNQTQQERVSAAISGGSASSDGERSVSLRSAGGDREPENSYRSSSSRRGRASVLAIERMKVADNILSIKSNQSSLTLRQRVFSRVILFVKDPYLQSFLAW